MSRKIESRCVDCGFPCRGNACPNYKVQVNYCDVCGSEGAKYSLDGDDMCEECAETIDKVMVADVEKTIIDEVERMVKDETD